MKTTKRTAPLFHVFEKPLLFAYGARSLWRLAAAPAHRPVIQRHLNAAIATCLFNKHPARGVVRLGTLGVPLGTAIVLTGITTTLPCSWWPTSPSAFRP
jgi:hypothetical protein